MANSMFDQVKPLYFDVQTWSHDNSSGRYTAQGALRRVVSSHSSELSEVGFLA